MHINVYTHICNTELHSYKIYTYLHKIYIHPHKRTHIYLHRWIHIYIHIYIIHFILRRVTFSTICGGLIFKYFLLLSIDVLILCVGTVVYIHTYIYKYIYTYNIYVCIRIYIRIYGYVYVTYSLKIYICTCARKHNRVI